VVWLLLTLLRPLQAAQQSTAAHSVRIGSAAVMAVAVAKSNRNLAGRREPGQDYPRNLLTPCTQLRVPLAPRKLAGEVFASSGHSFFDELTLVRSTSATCLLTSAIDLPKAI